MIIKYREEDQWFLANTVNPKAYGEDSIEIDSTDPLLTLESLVELWEMDMEGGNYHSMMSIPDSFVVLMRKHNIPESTIKDMIYEIINSGAWLP